MDEVYDEEWRPIDGYEERYQVSNLGRVRNIKTGNYKTPVCNWAGYCRVQLCFPGKTKIFSLHRLVAIAFIPNPKKYREINHIDHNRKNNNVDNLEWCTRAYNATHSFTRKDRKIGRAWLGKGGKSFHLSKPIFQIKDGIIINKFPSATRASAILKFHQSGIARCCRGERKSFKGFQWEFV